jgi:O-antigen/teichoic acid export membrane protein
MRETAHGSMVLLLGQVASKAVLAVAQIIIANLLEQERLGDYTVILVPIGVAILFQDPGISVGLTSYIARYHHKDLEEQRKTIILAGLMFNVFISLLLTSLVFLLSPLIASAFLRKPYLEVLLRVASLAIFGQVLITTTNAIFVGLGRMELQSYSMIIFSVIRGVLSPLLVIVGFSTLGAVAGHSASQIVTGLIGLSLTHLLLRNTKGEVKIRPMVKELTQLIRYGLPVYLSSLLSGGLYQIYNSLMVLYVVNTQIGNYSAALNFTIVVGFVTGSISIAIFPLFSKIRAGDPNLDYSYKIAVKYSSLFALPIAGALTSLSDPVIRVIFNDRFPFAASYLQIYMLTYIYVGLGSVATGDLLNGQGKTRINLRCMVITLLTGGPLALYLIPNYGIFGLILTLIISPLPSISYGLFWVKRNLGISPDWRSSAKIYSSVIISSGFTLIFVWVQSNLWVRLFGGAAIFLVSYFVMIRVLRVLDSTDYEMIRMIVSDMGVLSRMVNRLIDLVE